MILKLIEEERLNIKNIEDRNRKQLDDLRDDSKRSLRAQEDKQLQRVQSLTEDKRKMIEDVNKTIELEKEKIVNLHRIDIENREIQYKRNLEKQKQIYEEQHENLKKHLQQKSQINLISEDLQKNSLNINVLIQKISLEQELSLRNREDAFYAREKVLDEKKRNLQERRVAIEQKKKKQQLEMEEL